MNRKKGISTVVATVLILLITVVIAGIVSQVVVPFVQKSLSESRECFVYRDYFIVEESLGYSCFQKNSNNAFFYGISIKASVGDDEIANEVNGFKLVFIKDSSSKTKDVISGLTKDKNQEGVWILGERVLGGIRIPKQGEVLTYVYNGGIEEYKKIEVYPILKSGKICPMTDNMKVIECTKNADGENVDLIS